MTVITATKTTQVVLANGQQIKITGTGSVSNFVGLPGFDQFSSLNFDGSRTETLGPAQSAGISMSVSAGIQYEIIYPSAALRAPANQTPAAVDALGQLRNSRGGALNLRKVRGARLFSGSAFATAGTPAGTTWHATVALPVPFTHVAPLFFNLETGTITIGACAVAAVANATPIANGGVYPSSSATWVPALFAGAASGVMPARAAANQPQLFAADMTALQSIPSNDGSGMYYVGVRAYMPGTGYSYVGFQQSLDADAATIAALGNQKMRVSSQLVDGVTTPASFTQGASTGNSVLCGVMFRSESGVLTVAECGDSTTRGFIGSGANSSNTGGGVAGSVMRALAAMTTPALPAVCANAGCAGAVPADYEANGERYLALLKPACATYQIASINRAVVSQAIADESMAYFLKFVDFCQGLGIVPIGKTCKPQNLGSVGADVYRQALNTRLKTLCSSLGLLCIDEDAAVADPAAPYQYLAAYDSGDHSHPSNAGYDVLKDAARAVMSQLI
jgi:hypothetical protein